MARKPPEPKLFLDGDISDQWRIAWVECLGVDGWISRTDYWPVGLTLKPNVDPATLRQEVCRALCFPAGTLLDGSTVEGITWQPHEVRLVNLHGW